MNYNSYSKPNKNNRQNRKPVEEVDNATLVEKNVEPKFVEGVVTDCIALNIRKSPSMDADVVHVADAGCRVTIDLEHSTDEWYRVAKIFDEDAYGFCMKKFIEEK